MDSKKRWQTKGHYLFFLVVSISVLATALLAAPTAERPSRLIAHTQSEVASALEQGCQIVRQVKSMTALVCSADAARVLDLQQDIQVFAVDSKANAQIRADAVHTSGNTGAGRKIAVLDSGYNYLHPDLASSYGGGRDFANNDDDAMDDNGHGSHVAGIITADGINSKAKGAAPDAIVIAGKVLDSSGSGYFSDVVAAIYWVVDGPDGVPETADDFNADAISLSLGTSAPYLYKGYCDGALPDLTAAIQYAVSRGVSVVVAAGNSGGAGVSIPGCISYSTTVGAVDSLDKIAKFSGRGASVDITAPGVGIYSAWLGSSYYTASGTSMATPVVSATIALIKAAHPTYSQTQVQTALYNSAKDLGKSGKDTSFGWGRVDAQAAVNYVS